VLATVGSRGSPQLKPGSRPSLASRPSRSATATGLTFYDELVSQFFGTRRQCLLVTAVGVPRTATAGGAPGAPASSHYDQLMVRLSSRLRGGF
jgi:hypothetical protein